IRANITDQVGDAPASVVLDLIADEWREARARDGHREHRPLPTVPVLASWLRDRLDWACSRLPDSIDTHADEIRRLAGRLKALNGNTKARTEPIDRKSTRLNSSHVKTSYAVFRLKKKKRTDY